MSYRQAMANGERRRESRFQMQLPCCVSFPREKSVECEGVTRDISRSGMAVRFGGSASNGPAIGTTVQIRVSLSKGPDFPQRCLHCMAQVARVEHAENDQHMVAFQVGRMQFGKRELGEGVSADSTAPMR